MRPTWLALAALAAPAAAEPAVVARGRATVAASALAERSAGVTATRFELDRAELGATVTAGAHGTGLVTLEAIRSAGPDSAMGIDGDSLVVRIRHAALGARWRRGDLTLAAQLGVVPDPWIAALADHPERALGRALVESTALIAPSDLGATAEASLAGLTLVVAVGNGEGARDIERNRGKTTSVVLRAERAVADLGTVGVVAYGRDGSLGPGAARSHRAGAALQWRHPRGAAGAELVRAWGVGTQPDATAWAATAWADAPIAGGAGASARLDRLVVDGATASVRTWRGAVAPWWQLGPGLRAELALELERADDDAAPIAGVAAATDVTRGLLRVHGTFEGSP